MSFVTHWYLGGVHYGEVKFAAPVDLVAGQVVLLGTLFLLPTTLVLCTVLGVV